MILALFGSWSLAGVVVLRIVFVCQLADIVPISVDTCRFLSDVFPDESSLAVVRGCPCSLFVLPAFSFLWLCHLGFGCDMFLYAVLCCRTLDVDWFGLIPTSLVAHSVLAWLAVG